MLETLKSEHSVHKIGLHLVWCTKYRHSILVDGVDIMVKRTIGEACGHYGWKIRSIEVMPDHVHLFLQIDPTNRPCDIAQTLKSLTALAVFTAFPKLKGDKFWGSGLWSRDTYYGSVGDASVETIATYINNQKKR